jgi:enoyl-CoA hydratase/carnithine racemase
MGTSEELILVEKCDNHVAKIIMNSSPLNLNSIQSLTEMKESVRALDLDEDVKAIIITGAGTKAFNCGSDLSEYDYWKEDIINRKFKLETDLLNMIEFSTKPYIAAIEGYCLGGGLEVALACDFRIISEKTKMGSPEIDLGVFPGAGGLFRLPRVVGRSKAMEMMMLGEIVDADECIAIGLADKKVESGEVMASSIDLAEKIALKPSNVIGAIKKGTREFCVESSKENYYPNLEMIEDIYNQYNAIEGIDAFLSKRRPEFK